nr:unnamed protein product [Digitaria exilis]
MVPNPVPRRRSPQHRRSPKGPAIRRGAAERGEGWPQGGVDLRRAAAREPGRRKPRCPSSSPPLCSQGHGFQRDVITGRRGSGEIPAAAARTRWPHT